MLEGTCIYREEEASRRRTIADDDGNVLLNGIHGDLIREVVGHEDLLLRVCSLCIANKQADVVPRAIRELLGIPVKRRPSDAAHALIPVNQCSGAAEPPSPRERITNLQLFHGVDDALRKPRRLDLPRAPGAGSRFTGHRTVDVVVVCWSSMGSTRAERLPLLPAEMGHGVGV